MELLLNLIWTSLALLGFLVFMRGHGVSSRVARVSYRKSLFALAFGVILLFPVVSASDDLHPTQAVMEEASKRVQLTVAPLHLLRTNPPVSMLPVVLALFLMCLLVVLQLLHPSALKACPLDGSTVLSGRTRSSRSLQLNPRTRAHLRGHEAFCTDSQLAGLVLTHSGESRSSRSAVSGPIEERCPNEKPH